MNYFIDIPTFSRFYALNDEDDEKPPPDLKSTGTRAEERKIKKGRRRKQTPESKEKAQPADETMASTSRKEKSLWPDWQFWKRSDGSTSGGPFGAFRKNTKSTGAFTFRKDINDTIKDNKPKVTDEHASTDFSINVGQRITDSENKAEEVVVRGTVSASELEKDDPLVSYKKESNGSKHVVINMTKIETLAERKNAEFCRTAAESSSGIMEEKYSRNGHMENNGTVPQTYPPLRNVNDFKLGEERDTSLEVQKMNAERKCVLQTLTTSPQNGSILHGKSNAKSHSKNSKTVRQQFNIAPTNAPQVKKGSGEIKRKENERKMTKNASKHPAVEIKKPLQKAALSMPLASRRPLGKIDEKPCSSKQQPITGDVSKQKSNTDGCFKTIKNNKIPAPGQDLKPTGNVPKGACLEQGRLHNVLKKVTETRRPGNNSAPAQATAHEIQTQTAGRKAPGIAKAVRGNVAEVQSLMTTKPDDTTKIQPRVSENVPKHNNVFGKARPNTASESSFIQTNGKAKDLYDRKKQQASKVSVQMMNGEVKNVRKTDNSTQVTRPIMKDASTATPRARATVDAEVQVPAACTTGNDVSDTTEICLSMADETENLLKKRPWDTERVLKMQVLLDEKQVVIGQLKDAGRRQRDELRASRKRCAQLEEVIDQAKMEGKPQLVIQINELTDIKNELLTEVTRLTVDIEKERTNVKALKTELIEIKGQLNAARKKNGSLSACQ